MNDQTKKSRLVLFWQRRPFLLAGLLIAIGLTTFFGVRTVAFYNHIFADRPHIVEPWMRPHYISRTFGLQYSDVLDVLDIDETNASLKRLSIAQIARRTDEDVDALIDQLEELIDKHAQPGHQ
ncbi:MAG: hypothetical protein WA921_04975 [Ahrensia sp.]